MNRIALVAATLALLVFAAVAIAASPLPSASPAASPTSTPAASAYPATAPSASPGASPSPGAPSPANSTSGTSSSSGAGGAPATGAKASSTTWTADVNPVVVKGTATLTRNSDGTGTLVLQLSGMVNEQRWTVDVEPGYVQHPNDSNTIAFKQGSDVRRLSPDKITVTLTKSEMQDFDHALSANPGGVTIFVSDGHRLSAANIPASTQ